MDLTGAIDGLLKKIYPEDCILSAKEEAAGIEDATRGKVKSAPIEGVAVAMHARISRASERITPMGQPTSLNQAWVEIQQTWNSMLNPDEDLPKFAMRNSCTTGERVLVLYRDGAEQYHWELGNLRTGEQKILVARIDRVLGSGIELMEDNNYTLR